MSQKSILFIIQHLHNGGSEGTIAKLSIAFSKYFNVHIATFFSKEDYPNSFEYQGKLHCHNETKKTFPPLTIWRRMTFINKIIEENKIDVVISFLFNADLVNALTKSKNHTSIVGIRTSVDLLIHSPIKTFLYRLIFKKVDTILVQNGENKNLLKRQFNNSWKDKIKIISNMFDVEFITKKSQEGDAFKNEKGIILTTLGRYSEVKGHRHLIRILGSIKKGSDEKFKLIIIGDGPLRSNYISLINSLDLVAVESDEDIIDLDKGDVFLIGFRSNPFKYINDSDFFVFSSYFEGSPNALAEAMIIGTPVISSKCAVGPSDLLESKLEKLPEETELGTLMPVFDSTNLVQEDLSENEIRWKTFLLSLEDRRDELTKKAREAQNRMKDYDNKIIIKQWMNLIS